MTAVTAIGLDDSEDNYNYQDTAKGNEFVRKFAFCEDENDLEWDLTELVQKLLLILPSCFPGF